MRPYGEREYRAAVALLARRPEPCWRGCGRLATTPDHVPALAEHFHIAGSGCCELRPSCQPCNLDHGARLGARRRWRPATASRHW